MAKRKMIRPVLSIGIIFKNEIRCLERCLVSLVPLRKKVPCELIMADTGSDDGSREVAARYADILFDFPWINDFAAARNAVLDKVTGKWFLSIDADEWLDKDVSELVGFFNSNYAENSEICSLIVRNYYFSDSTSDYADSQGVRLVKRFPWTRFEGNIHEKLRQPEGRGWHITALGRTILHHDGYVCMNEGNDKSKEERNLALIKKRLEETPEDLALLTQYYESGKEAEDRLGVLNRAVELVEKKTPQWNYLGPALFRYAVTEAYGKEKSDLEIRIAKSREWFPEAFFTRIDVEYFAFGNGWDKHDYEECAQCGERYLQAIEDYHGNRGDRWSLMCSGLKYASISNEQQIRIYMALAYLEIGESLKALQVLEGMRGAMTDASHARNLASALRKIQTESEYDTSFIIQQIFEDNNLVLGRGRIEKKSQESKQTNNWENGKKSDSKGSLEEEAWNAFVLESWKVFQRSYREEEKKPEYDCRPAYTLFLPLESVCDLGRAAAILETDDSDKMEKYLSEVEDWTQFPAEVLFHALCHGLIFPIRSLSLNVEQMEGMIGILVAERDNQELAILAKGALRCCTSEVRLGREVGEESERNSGEEPRGDSDRTLVKKTREEISKTLPQIVWAQRLAYALINAFDWKGEGDGVEVVRFFAYAEKDFLERNYSSEAMKEENLPLLQSEHRFGWYCAQAFAILDKGDIAGYVKKLREGLEVSPETRFVAEYLLERTPQLKQEKIRQKEEASPELLALAEQVKMILKNYAPDDPGVVALKESEAYQKVAWLIEE